MNISRVRATAALFLRYLALAKKTWTWPRKSPVLIYDACSQEILLEYLRPWGPEILYCRGEQLNMPVLLASLVRRGKRWNAYVDEYIERTQPQLIITFIDNNQSFYSLAARHGNIKTMFIQNGYRGYYLDVFEHLSKQSVPTDRYWVDYMLTFGSITAAEYAKYISGSLVPMGSITNNHIPKANAHKRGVIAYLSQYKKGGVQIGAHYFSQEQFYRAQDRIIIEFLVEYASKRRRSLFVITRARTPSELEEEQAYFRALGGEAVTFFSGEGFGASYISVDQAEVVVSNTSTLGLESAARNTKTAFFTIHKHIYEMHGLIWDRGIVWPSSYPDDGPFWTSRADPDAFERILDHLFEIDDHQWRAELSEHGFANIMAYDPGNSILKSILIRELGDPAYY